MATPPTQDVGTKHKCRQSPVLQVRATRQDGVRHPVTEIQGVTEGEDENRTEECGLAGKGCAQGLIIAEVTPAPGGQMQPSTNWPESKGLGTAS